MAITKSEKADPVGQPGLQRVIGKKKPRNFSVTGLIFFGAKYGARTHDPRNHNPLLYQLS